MRSCPMAHPLCKQPIPRKAFVNLELLIGEPSLENFSRQWEL